MLSTMVLMSILLQIMRIIEHVGVGMGSLRVFWVLGVGVVHLILAKNKHHSLANALLIFLPPFFFLFIPTFLGFVEEESFVYYPVIIIAMSMVPQLLISLPKDKLLYWLAMLYYTILLVSIDVLLYHYADPNLKIVPLYKDMIVFYKSIYLVIFLFVNFSVFYLRKLNLSFELELKMLNRSLRRKTNALEVKNKALDQSLLDLKNTQNQLVHSEKMASLGTLMAGIAHEINTPLNFISTGTLLIQNALDDICDEQIKDSACVKEIDKGKDVVNQGIDRAINIVSSLKTFSYSGEATKNLHSMHNIVESTLRFLNQKIPEDIEVIKNYADNDDALLIADKMHQVILNLIDNALYELVYRSGTMKKKLILTTQRKDDVGFVRFSVFNSGSSIPESVQSKMFDPFYTTKPPEQGTGLGLSTSFKLIAEHNGELSCRNVNDGVEFMVDIPVGK